MLHFTRSFVLRIGAALMAVWLAGAASAACAQDMRSRFDQPALDAMLAPIALYPDQLLTQVLMAATYPEEVAEAARWSRERPGLSGDAAVRTAEGFDWDPSVRSLTAFPQVLDTMFQHMAWTEDLGRAFIAQPQEVMDTVQRLRARAYEAGTLASNDHSRVVDTGAGLVIESAQPQVVYVPYYDTRVAYGPWWWPARPPMYWSRWHGYSEPYGRPGIVQWGPGVALGSGFFFGGFDWHRHEVRVVNPRPYYYAYRDHRPAYAAPHVWRHDSERRAAWRQRNQPAQNAQFPAQRPPQARQDAPAAGALPQRRLPQVTDDDQPRGGRLLRDSDRAGNARTAPPVRNVNPVPQQATRPVQPVPQFRQEAPATGAVPPRRMPQVTDDDQPRRARRSVDGDADARAGPPARSSVAPAPQPRASPPPAAQEAPRGNIEERRARALSRDRD